MSNEEKERRLQIRAYADEYVNSLENIVHSGYMISVIKDVIEDAVIWADSHPKSKIKSMKAKDLMLGDWVIHYGHPTKITGLSPEIDTNDEIHYYFFNDVEWYSIDELEPIPLTEEILKKNFPEDDTGYEIGWWPTEGGKYHIEFSKDKMEVDIECGVDYVHELQHLLRLCKIDKEIVLI